ncbi:phage tail tape measure protein [Stenotrophomonas sp. PS02298]|uniref:phage tail tape measure protein n=1 Tax=Stenotrophomonas sp. PS02298 TaxID=2991424 RepID=UPI00249B4E59|nr:phage tail tape measure protein [Stenotrophomonas sp. PS02298]
MNNTLSLAARLSLDARNWARGLTEAQGGTKKFVGTVKREFDNLRGFAQSTTGLLAQIGLGYGAVNTMMQSAKTDLSLIRIKQTAGMTGDQVKQLRVELHQMARDAGNTFQALEGGFGQLAAGGLEYAQALPATEAINKSMRVTGSEATTLATALQSAQEHFQFDLSEPGKALEILDKMTVAGRAGVIEIEDLAGVFATAAGNAKAANLTFDETLALVEGLGTATTKDRVGTLMDSTLRLFTNANYMREAQKATGIKFFNSDGDRRNALEVMAEIKTMYDKLGTDRERFGFISKAFGKADLDTIKGINTAMKEGKIDQILQIAAQTRSAGGTTERDFGETMDNAVSQAGVLRATLAQAGDQFAQPFNKALAESIKYLTSEDGLGLDGFGLAGAGAAAAGGAYVGGRVLKGQLGKLMASLGGNTAGLASGLVMGNALQQAGGATPVFVVGAAPGLFSGMGGGGGLLQEATEDSKASGKWKALAGGVALGGATLAALAAAPLLRYRGTLADGMQDETLQEDVGHTMRRSRGRGLLASARRQDEARRDAGLDVAISVKDDRVTAAVTNTRGLTNVTTRTSPSRRYVPRTGRMMGGDQ